MTDTTPGASAETPPAPERPVPGLDDASLDDTTFPGNVGTLTTKEALPLIREVTDPAVLHAARHVETTRADGPRETIMRAIERTKGQLRFADSDEEVDLAPSRIERMTAAELREVAAVKGIEGRGARHLRKALLAEYEATGETTSEATDEETDED